MKDFPYTVIFFILLNIFAISMNALADGDDDTVPDTTFEDSTLDFTSPDSLEPFTEYLFEFNVFNASWPGEEKGIWIYKVELFFGPWAFERLAAYPTDCLHPDVCRQWQPSSVPFFEGIVWEAMDREPDRGWGDIREQEVKSFRFLATFGPDISPFVCHLGWAFWGDDGSVTQNEWDFSGVNCYDDDDIPDDDTNANIDDDGGDASVDGESEDENSGACGC